MEPPEEAKKPNPFQQPLPKPTRIYDARPLAEEHLSDNHALDNHGFMLHKHATAMKPEDFFSNDKVVADYYPESAKIVESITGASKVLVFDHVVR